MGVELTWENGVLVLRSPYDPAFVAEFKAQIPYTERKFDFGRKVWEVAPQHGQTIAGLVQKYYGEHVTIPTGGSAKSEVLTKVLHVRYVGATKDRGGVGERTAFGNQGGEWAVVFPESVLRLFFTGIAHAVPTEQTSLYAILGVIPQATPEEIKTAYRRFARQWHPDICKESDANVQFIQIKRAYDILSGPDRGKYDAGLALQNTLLRAGGGREFTGAQVGYRPPLRCGYVLAEGVVTFGRFTVSKIIDWQDITNARGQTLVVSWPGGAETWEEVWV